MSQPTEQYDVIIIGAGQAGGPLSTALAKAGKKTAIIEREHVGGTCINEGCTPTKTMVASARAAYVARRGPDYGVLGGNHITVDLVKVRDRKRTIVREWSTGSQQDIENTDNVDLLLGNATFTGPKVISVTFPNGQPERILTAPTIFINTGEHPSLPNISGLHDMPTLNSTSIMELDHVPEHLVILGGGYIALEFGQMFRRFGSQVTIINRGKQLLSREDTDIAEEVLNILREDGITVFLEAKIESASGTANVTFTPGNGASQTVEGSHLLVATGRMPNTKDLNLTATGVQTNDKGYIIVDDYLETNVPGIFALGDVKGGPAFTHISYDDYRIVKANYLQGEHRSIANRLVPYAVFIDPQLARVGINEAEARQQGRNILVAKLPMSSVARAIETDETRGFMKAIVDVETQQILGCAILGIEGGEIMTAVQIAMMGKLPYTALRDAAFAHPTLCESLNNLFMTLD